MYYCFNFIFNVFSLDNSNSYLTFYFFFTGPFNSELTKFKCTLLSDYNGDFEGFISVQRRVTDKLMSFIS